MPDTNRRAALPAATAERIKQRDLDPLLRWWCRHNTTVQVNGGSGLVRRPGFLLRQAPLLLRRTPVQRLQSSRYDGVDFSEKLPPDTLYVYFRSFFFFFGDSFADGRRSYIYPLMPQSVFVGFQRFISRYSSFNFAFKTILWMAGRYGL
ncbi:unnamed protein product [Cuscuta epithymum]|uniref:Uncharacterized protein n=1 Tax=Cuscuta epithymum TaxID=186058 RepID=A0AAV0FXG8_9ASTE|nr:unnamed protein product [Cuscuta epithymum]